MRAGLALLVATITGCDWTSSAPSCDQSSALCQSALTIIVRNEGGQPFAPGMYAFELTLDGVRRDIECAVDGTMAGGSRCLEQSSPSVAAPVLHSFEVVGFKISVPPARRAVVAMRNVCGSGGLHTQRFEPTYSCTGECRRADVTMTVGAGFTICPDVGAPETGPPPCGPGEVAVGGNPFDPVRNCIKRTFVFFECQTGPDAGPGSSCFAQLSTGTLFSRGDTQMPSGADVRPCTDEERTKVSTAVTCPE